MDSKYVVDKISENVWAITDIRVRCFLIEGTDYSVMLDTGFGTGELQDLVKELVPTKRHMLINTHADRDHTGKNTSFGPAHMHPGDFTRYHNAGREDTRVSALWDGMSFDLGGLTLEVIYLPGHTPGSIALLDRENRVLFGGDTILSKDIFMAGPGRNMNAYLASMEKLKGMTDRFDLIYGSHHDLEVSPAIIPTLAEGVALILKGEIQGEDLEEGNRLAKEAKRYSYKDISFLGNPEGYGKVQ